jgi:hypothetical protein
MASIVLKVPVTDDGVRFVEIETDLPGPAPDDGVAFMSRSGDPDRTVRGGPSLVSSMDNALGAVSAMLTRLRAADQAPDEAQMSFGLKVGGETGLIFAKGSTEATFVVTLTWHKPQSGAGDADGATRA